jgi:hypothetical protein
MHAWCVVKRSVSANDAATTSVAGEVVPGSVFEVVLFEVALLELPVGVVLFAPLFDVPLLSPELTLELAPDPASSLQP